MGKLFYFKIELLREPLRLHATSTTLKTKTNASNLPKFELERNFHWFQRIKWPPLKTFVSVGKKARTQFSLDLGHVLSMTWRTMKIFVTSLWSPRKAKSSVTNSFWLLAAHIFEISSKDSNLWPIRVFIWEVSNMWIWKN